MRRQVPMVVQVIVAGVLLAGYESTALAEYCGGNDLVIHNYDWSQDDDRGNNPLYHDTIYLGTFKYGTVPLLGACVNLAGNRGQRLHAVVDPSGNLLQGLVYSSTRMCLTDREDALVMIPPDYEYDCDGVPMTEVNHNGNSLSIWARDGNDFVWVGGRKTHVKAGKGDDMIVGSRDSDATLTVYGNAGNDVLLGQSGTNKLFGDSGADYIAAKDAFYGDGDSRHYVYCGGGGDSVCKEDDATIVYYSCPGVPITEQYSCPTSYPDSWNWP